MASTPTSATALDPLVLLRQFTIHNRPIELLDSDGNLTTDLLKTATVRFGDEASFPRDAPTSYSRSSSDSDHYTLSAVLYFLDHRDQSFYEYMKLTNSMGLQNVSFGDRAALLDYLTGKTNTLVSAAASAAATATGSNGASSSASASASSGKRANADSANDGNRSRARLDANGSFSRINDATREVVRRERALITTSSVLSSTKSFTRVPDLIKELFPPKNAPKGPDGKPIVTSTKHASGLAVGTSASASSATNGTKSSSHIRASQRKRANPIIIVPAATTAMINMYNIEDLLKDHQFSDGRTIMERGEAKPREIFIEHTLSRTDQRLRFRVVDSVQDFTEADWNSLVCVFTQGAPWQFKNWIWKSPENIFQNTLGFYPKYNDEKLKESIKTWGISVLNIERTKRHMDKAAVVGMWTAIEQYIATKKPEFFN
ncbi:accessory factor associated with RNA polymerase II [Coemansia sp. RSA 2703]|nr:accessory factor associated with RNA polymerase II [Coemansia sp. RSA 2703]KAJ2375574.1 accessory factor associated with RNA polymerase II [Coemansia sp. RSA 2607]KAJ2398012.1 accessory factor associated with RNA polymerase II [Coemansia sp. RSA 2603]